MSAPLQAGAVLTILAGLVLFNVAETTLLGILVVAGGCYALVLPRFIAPKST